MRVSSRRATALTDHSGLDLRFNERGFEAMLKGKDGFRTRDDLIRRGRRVAAAAGPGMEVDTDDEGRTRARVTVWTATIEARVAEARHRALTRSIDAAR